MSSPAPEQLPIFPLPNVVLFPGVRLPLHIFEQRYRTMARDALSGSRLIGMVLLKPDVDAAQARAPIYSVGCIGRIAESERLPDGRFVMLLEGSRRFHIASEESGDRPYRVVQADLLPDPSFADLAASDRVTLSRARVEIERKTIELVRGQTGSVPKALQAFMQALDPVQLLHELAFHLECRPVEKQGLLEAVDPPACARLLEDLLDFRAAELRTPADATNLN